MRLMFLATVFFFVLPNLLAGVIDYSPVYSLGPDEFPQREGFVSPTPLFQTLNNDSISFTMNLLSSCGYGGDGLKLEINGENRSVCSNCPSRVPGKKVYSLEGLEYGLYDYSFFCNGERKGRGWTLLSQDTSPIFYSSCWPMNNTLQESSDPLSQDFSCRITSSSYLVNSSFFVKRFNDSLGEFVPFFSYTDEREFRDRTIHLSLSNLSGTYLWGCGAFSGQEYFSSDSRIFFAEVSSPLLFNESVTFLDRFVSPFEDTLYFEWGFFDSGVSNCELFFDGHFYHGDISDNNCVFSLPRPSPGENYSFYGLANDDSGVLRQTLLHWIYVYDAPYDVEGRWVIRAPVAEEDVESGDSYPCIHCSTGNPFFPGGNGQDIGVFLRADTEREGSVAGETYEERHCGGWFQSYFDEEGYPQGRIDNAYCRLWLYGTNLSLNGNIKFSSEYNGDASDPYGTRQSWNSLFSRPSEGYPYHLGIYYLPNFVFEWTSPEELWNLSLHGSADDIQVISSPNQLSSCFFNFDSPTQLLEKDTDLDGLTDYEELFFYFSDPYMGDTDLDGFSDYVEALENTDPSDPYDRGSLLIYSPHWADSSYSEDLDSIVSLNESLDDSFSLEQIDLMGDYDNEFAIFEESFPGRNVQTNYHFVIDQPLSEITSLQVFWGGEFESILDSDNVFIHVFNQSGSSDYVLSGKKWVTRALFTRIFADELSHVLTEEGDLYLGVYINDTSLASKIKTDFVQVRVFSEGTF